MFGLPTQYPLPTSSCKRSLWTTPLVLLLKEIVPRATIMIWCFAVICRTFNTFFCTTILSNFLWVFFRVSGWQWYFVWKIVRKHVGEFDVDCLEINYRWFDIVLLSWTAMKIRCCDIGENYNRVVWPLYYADVNLRWFINYPYKIIEQLIEFWNTAPDEKNF